MKIIDSFIFYNEMDLLLYRLSILDEYVDYFIIVESTHTFVGKEKPLFYNENKSLFQKFNDKIIHIIVDDFPYKLPNINYMLKQQNVNENYQRECIKKGIQKISLQDQDIIIFSDLDEIPNPNIFKNIIERKIILEKNTFYRLECDMYYYNLNLREGNGRNWHGIKLMTYYYYKNMNLTFQQVRLWEHTHYVPVIENGGWHLSYFGDETFIFNKLHNFKEMEQQHANACKNMSLDSIKEKIKNKTNLLTNSNLVYIPIKENNNLPYKYDIYLTKFYLQ